MTKDNWLAEELGEVVLVAVVEAVSSWHLAPAQVFESPHGPACSHPELARRGKTDVGLRHATGFWGCSGVTAKSDGSSYLAERIGRSRGQLVQAGLPSQEHPSLRKAFQTCKDFVESPGQEIRDQPWTFCRGQTRAP